MATIAIRRLDSSWTPVFGHGILDFLTDGAAVTQLIQQRLRLWRGTWFEDRSIGTPWLQSILGSPAHGAYRAAVSDLLRSIILEVPFVSSVTSVLIRYEPTTLTMTVVFDVMTEFGAIASSVSVSSAGAILNA